MFSFLKLLNNLNNQSYLPISVTLMFDIMYSAAIFNDNPKR